MKPPTSFKTRVALTCLLGGLLLYTCRPRLPEIETNWTPAPAALHFASMHELHAWAGWRAEFTELPEEEGTGDATWLEVRRLVKRRDFWIYPYQDLSLFIREEKGFRLVAHLPFSWHTRRSYLQPERWIVNEHDTRGWKRLVEVRLDRTEPLIVSATE